MKTTRCEICNSIVQFNKLNNKLGKYCSDECNNKARKIRNNIPIKLNEYNIDRENLVVWYNNKKLDKKRKFQLQCEECGSIFNTTINYLKNKEFKWSCHSCSVKNAWKKDDYIKSHVEGNIAAWTPYRRQISADSCLKNWAIPEFRDKMVKIFRDPAIKKKSLDNRKYKRIHAFGCAFRSTYEYRLAAALTEHNIIWKFEPMYFRLKSLNKIYFPDFYLPEYNLWIETKGYWTDIAKLKFKTLKIEYPDIKIMPFYLENIIRIEKGFLNEITK